MIGNIEEVVAECGDMSACMSQLSQIGIPHLPFFYERAIANITHWKPERIEALTRVLKGEFDGLVGGDVDPVTDRIYGVLFVLKELADRVGVSTVLGKTPMGRLVLFLVLARIADQGSRLSAVRWGQDHCVEEILGLDELTRKICIGPWTCCRLGKTR